MLAEKLTTRAELAEESLTFVSIKILLYNDLLKIRNLLVMPFTTRLVSQKWQEERPRNEKSRQLVAFASVLFVFAAFHGRFTAFPHEKY